MHTGHLIRKVCANMVAMNNILNDFVDAKYTTANLTPSPCATAVPSESSSAFSLFGIDASSFHSSCSCASSLCSPFSLMFV